MSQPDAIERVESAELVARARQGDVEAFGRLVDEHRRAVYRAALAAIGSPDEADDVAQDTFVTAFRKIQGFRGESSFRTWLLSIAWNKALDRRKRGMRWLRLTVTGKPSEAGEVNDPLDHVAGNEASQEQTLVSAEMERHIRRLIGTLPPKLKHPLLLAGSGEHSYDDIAGMLRIPLGTVKWRVSEARRLLRQKLAGLGYAADQGGRPRGLDR